MLNLHNKKLILFDFDGTLVDSMNDFAKIASRVMSKFYSVEKSWALNKYFETSGIPFSHQLEEIFPKHYLNPKASDEFENEKKITYFNRPLYTDVRKTISSLKEMGIKIAVSSNNFQELVEKYLSVNGLPADLMMGYKNGFAKGEDHFRHAQDLLKLNKDEMLFVGDSIKDGEKAFSFGIDFIGKTGIFTKEEFESKFSGIIVIDKLEELVKMISHKINSPQPPLNLRGGVTAIIMAAGMGTRLKHLTSDLPKALVKVCDRELLDWTLDFLNHEKITRIIIVGGFKFEDVKKFASSKNKSALILENKDYKKGNILSLKTALDHVDTDLLLCNVDHIFPKGMLDHILETCSNITAMCDHDRTLGDDDMKVKTDENGNLKDISKRLMEYDLGYIGMTYCSSEKIKGYKKCVDELIQNEGNMKSAEDVLKLMSFGGENIKICDCSGWGWHEIDTPQERERAQKILGEVL